MSLVVRRLLYGTAWLTTFGAHAEPALSPQAIALNCQTCHQQAAGDNLVPDLGPLSRQQMRQSLLDFKHDSKAGTIMPRLVKGYSDEELLAVADYLASQ